MSTVLLREIQSYEVIVQRSAKTPLRRVLRLALKPIRGNPLTAVELVFEANPKDLGALDEPMATLRLPLDDYADGYHLLQTEKPVHVAASTDTKGKVIYAALTTSPEALGEGFRDADA
jgi:hypothetical protein